MRTISPVLVVTLLAAAAPARAAISETAVMGRVRALFAAAGPAALGSWQVPDTAKIASTRAPVGRRLLEPLVPRRIWDASAPPSAAWLAWLQQRVPGLTPASVREISYDNVAAVITEAARRGNSTLDIFTDEGLRGDAVYFLSQATLERLYREFDLQTTLLQSGKDTDGGAFQMQALVMGRGSLSILYSEGPFDFKNPNDGNKYTVDGRVAQTIDGPGRLSISGMWVHAWPVTARIQKLVKLGPGRLRVETNYGSKELADPAVRRR